MIRIIPLLLMICLGITIPVLQAQLSDSGISARKTPKYKNNVTIVRPSGLKERIPESYLSTDNALYSKLSDIHLATFHTKQCKYICLFNNNQLAIIFFLPKSQSKKTLITAYESRKKIAQILDKAEYIIHSCGNNSQRFFMMEFTKVSRALKRNNTAAIQQGFLKNNPLGLIFYLSYKFSMPHAWVNNRPVWKKNSTWVKGPLFIHVNINEKILQSIDIRLSTNNSPAAKITSELNDSLGLALKNRTINPKRTNSSFFAIAIDRNKNAKLIREKKYLRIIGNDFPMSTKSARYNEWAKSATLKYPESLTDLDKLIEIKGAAKG